MMKKIICALIFLILVSLPAVAGDDVLFVKGLEPDKTYVLVTIGDLKVVSNEVTGQKKATFTLKKKGLLDVCITAKGFNLVYKRVDKKTKKVLEQSTSTGLCFPADRSFDLKSKQELEKGIIEVIEYQKLSQ